VAASHRGCYANIRAEAYTAYITDANTADYIRHRSLVLQDSCLHINFMHAQTQKSLQCQYF